MYGFPIFILFCLAVLFGLAHMYTPMWVFLGCMLLVNMLSNNVAAQERKARVDEMADAVELAHQRVTRGTAKE
jgi:uncharacterized membrane protein